MQTKPPGSSYYTDKYYGLTVPNSNLSGDSEEQTSDPNYQFKLMLYALLAIFFYYMGSFLIVFVRNDISGAIVSSAPNYEISWKLAFENFPQLLRNAYDSFFGYFYAYAALYNRSTAFLVPVDIGVKLITVFYFIFFWMPWDTKRAYRLGFFNKDYPYVDDEYKEEIEDSKSKLVEATRKNEMIEVRLEQPVADPTDVDYKPLSLYPQYELNPYIRAQRLKSQSAANQIQNRQLVTTVDEDYEDDDEEDDDEDDTGILPFSGVQKPLEELYQRYEKAIYDFIRRRILPGSNILLVSYFSTLFIIDLANPLTLIFYILGVMSMFWCMQSFLMVIDHIQFPPDEN
jgi:hypothetical protein